MRLDGATTVVEVPSAPATSAPQTADDLIIEEARRRHRHRLLGVSAVVVVVLGLVGFGIATTFGSSPHRSSGRTLSTRPPSQAAARPSCSADQLTATLGSTGSTPRELDAALLTITNDSASRCEIATFPKLRLVDGVGKLIAVAPSPGQVDVRVQLLPHASAVANVYWQNWCGSAEQPISLQVVLPNRGGMLAAPFGATASLLPTCTDPSRGSSFVAVGGLDSGSLFGTGHRTSG